MGGGLACSCPRVCLLCWGLDPLSLKLPNCFRCGSWRPFSLASGTVRGLCIEGEGGGMDSPSSPSPFVWAVQMDCGGLR
ncbi:hypothetical protein HMPREF9134_00062 [Porphyromonas catoniae F0037]|uniref:Uncharacterized protein n=1 Tax=Porphyromonas catoniae F0037 TaxID=1127696 RepID=L1NJ89_9PORP|nr:hypothetical protein HMPREF9134_00062 [Porphyromonas catoniae F0037]